MLLQDAFIQRIIAITLFQTWPIFYHLYLARKLIKRSKNPLTITIGACFVIYSSAFLLRYPSLIIIPFSATIAYIFYFLAWFFLIFSQGFLVIFSWQLTKLSKPISLRQTLPWLFLNLAFSSHVILFGFLFKGIKYDATTDWVPVFSWEFALWSFFFISLYLIIPHTIFSFQLIRSFQGEIRKRIKRYIASVYMGFIIVLLLICYNTWNDIELIRVLNFAINVPASLLAAYFIYKSFGEELE